MRERGGEVERRGREQEERRGEGQRHSHTDADMGVESTFDQIDHTSAQVDGIVNS